ncbi:hypothetical protein IM774_03545 [Erysipelotrichaceae bacterium RD49]|nr:hypothetical protein [Erysipelotrichaceae bacterium RD49]
MIRLMTCLFLMLWILLLMWHYDLMLGWALVFWMLPAGWLLITQIASNRIFEASILFSLAILVFFQDYKTFYFSRRWSVLLLGLAGLGMLQPIGFLTRLSAMSFGLVLIPFCQKDKIGSADVWAMLAMGFALGFERMLAVLLVGCLGALGYALWSGQKMIPFLSFLAYGFVIACFKGYMLMETIEQVVLAW